MMTTVRSYDSSGRLLKAGRELKSDELTALLSEVAARSYADGDNK